MESRKVNKTIFVLDILTGNDETFAVGLIGGFQLTEENSFILATFQLCPLFLGSPDSWQQVPEVQFTYEYL